MNNKEKFHRNCLICKDFIYYTNIKNRNIAEKNKKKCRNCLKNLNKEKNRDKMRDNYLIFDEKRNNVIIDVFEDFGSNWKFFRKKIYPIISEFKKETKTIVKYRKCPECDKNIFYKEEASRKNAEKRKSLCKSCSKIGCKNSFYNKKHSKKTLNKIKKTQETSKAWIDSIEKKRTKEYKEYMSEKMSGENNGRYGKGSLYDIWLKKYGKEEAEKKHIEWRSKLSDSFSGEKNHMFGKPSPIGSGNGWSGWYKNWYFRSLRELSYMINEIEFNNLSWENGEKSKYKIPYIDWKGNKRNYFPDFVVDNKFMIECKPLNLHNSVDVIQKKEAAELFCLKNNLEYILIEPEVLGFEDIKKLYDDNLIKFLPKYEEKFLKLINNN